MSDTASFILIVTSVAIIAVYLAGRFFREKRQLARELRHLRQQAEERQAEINRLTAPKPRKTPEQWEADRQLQTTKRLEKQLCDVQQKRVTFAARTIMNRGELSLFDAGLVVTQQPKPRGHYPFYVFPQVSLGEVIETRPLGEWWAKDAYRAINSRRCDILLVNRLGIPIAALEYQGGGHYIDPNTDMRDQIKRIAFERAGIPFIEIANGASAHAIQQTIQSLCDQHLSQGRVASRSS